MDLYSQAKISPIGQVNKADLQKIARDTAIFFAAPVLIYLSQLQGTLAQNQILGLNNFIPSMTTIGAIEGWVISIGINFFLKFTTTSKRV